MRDTAGKTEGKTIKATMDIPEFSIPVSETITIPPGITSEEIKKMIEETLEKNTHVDDVNLSDSYLVYKQAVLDGETDLYKMVEDGDNLIVLERFEQEAYGLLARR